MRVRHKRRRKPVQWFPVLGEEPGFEQADFQQFVAPVSGQLSVVGNTPDINVVGLTWDFPTELEINSGTGIPSLADWQGSAWRHERTVGKCHLQQFIPSGGGTPISLVTAALMVLKVDENGAPLRAAQDYLPDTTGNIRDPWLWRRTWMLESSSTVDIVANLNKWPSTNAAYGSVADGPHVDCKSKRRIQDEERLFFVIAGRGFPWSANLSGRHALIDYVFDYRTLGMSMKQTNRRNASR